MAHEKIATYPRSAYANPLARHAFMGVFAPGVRNSHPPPLTRRFATPHLSRLDGGMNDTKRSLHRKQQRFLIFFLLGLGLFCTLSACSATSKIGEPTSTPLQPIATATLGLGALNEQIAVSGIEAHRLELKFSPKIRVGDVDTIRLHLSVDEEGSLTPTAEINGRDMKGEAIEIGDLYATHTLIAESRLDMAGIKILPSGIISEPLLPGESVTFFWRITAPEAGVYHGTVWFYLRYIPKVGGTEERRALSAQSIEIEATKFLGILSADVAKKLGVIGLFISAILLFPFLRDALSVGSAADNGG
ncbi:MAG TPA: hypothetical protein EYP74_04370 [Anaerolineales bacterium]|nr:hypothetical protein [Anaerolineales bacterium]